MKTTSLIFLVASLLFCLSEPIVSQSGTFTVHLPTLNSSNVDSIKVPDGRQIYALIVSGYSQNMFFDELLVYRFARELMSRGAYVHYSWWNNLLAPYMERPLHNNQSFPGNLLQDWNAFIDPTMAKALPGEDYQFVADAKLFLSAVRQHNPDAIIVVLGHSMGGASIVHLASQTSVRIDLLAPIDPVGNRNYPWAGNLRSTTYHYNWTRWRATRGDNFLGYKRLKRVGVNCVPDGNWLDNYDLAKQSSDPLCRPFAPEIHQAPVLTFGTNIVHLYHRWQREALFPFDFLQNYEFGHNPPQGGSTFQAYVPTTHRLCGFPPQRCEDPGGWPEENDPSERGCCPTGNGVGWQVDGHGEIVGHRGPLPRPVPLGVRVRTSPNCGSNCAGIWPDRYQENGEWFNGDAQMRRTLLEGLENLPIGSIWEHQPTNDDLCLVSTGLINLLNGIVTNVNTDSEIPEEFSLSQNYPNPFNPSTKIRYSVPKQSKVIIKVYDLLGREVATLVNELKPAGRYEVEFDASSLASGVYLYKLTAAGYTSIKKLMLMK